jgi:hypothetical protein
MLFANVCKNGASYAWATCIVQFIHETGPTNYTQALAHLTGSCRPTQQLLLFHVTTYCRAPSDGLRFREDMEQTDGALRKSNDRLRTQEEAKKNR